MEKKIYIIDGTFSAAVEAESEEDAKASFDPSLPERLVMSVEYLLHPCVRRFFYLFQIKSVIIPLIKYFFYRWIIYQF